MAEGRLTSDASKGKVVEELKTGFRYSFWSIILSLGFASYWMGGTGSLLLLYFWWFFLFGAIGTYVSGVIKRSRGWRLMNLRKTSLIIRTWAALVMLFFPLSFYSLRHLTYVQTAVDPPAYVLTGFHSTAFFSFLMLVVWGVYTSFETKAFHELKEHFGIDLRSAGFSAMIGTVIAPIALILNLQRKWYYNIGYFDMVYLPFLFSTPFMITSCILSLRGLEKAQHNHETPEKGGVP